MSNKLNEVILGFDARIILKNDNENIVLDWYKKAFGIPIMKGKEVWSEERKRDYLYKLDVTQPYSTDTLVWPSVFDIFDISRPDYVGFYNDLWEDLENLRRHINSQKNIPFHIISIVLQYNTCNREEKEEWQKLLAGIAYTSGHWIKGKSFACAKPSVIDKEWALTGYDVSDMFGLSGLLNCGFSPKNENIEKLKNKWSRHLNAHHLFNNLNKAVEFKNLSNERIKEHAPFFVYGIYKVFSTV